MKNPVAISKLQGICPFFDPSEPLCCLEDQAYIMESNFNTIDYIFGNDVPMCALNLKKMWCHYTCNPQKYKFVNGTGYKE